MPTCVQYLWTRTRLVLIPKPGGAGVRPLGLRDAWCRLVARLGVMREAQGLGEKLQREQLAIGVPGGCEIAAHIAQLQAEIINAASEDEVRLGLDQVLLCDDGRNCFNEIALGPVMITMREFVPSLTCGVHWLYGRPSPLIGRTGKIVGHREIGSAQGCPLGMLLCIMAFVPIAKEANRLAAVILAEELLATEQERAQRAALAQAERAGVQTATTAAVVPVGDVVVPGDDPDPDAGVFFAERSLIRILFFADDSMMSGPRRVMVRLCRFLPEIFAKAGITLVLEKGCVLVRDTTQVGVDAFPGRRVTSVGLKVLGNYVGKREYRIAEEARALADMIPNQQALRQLSPRVQFHLLYYCYNNRPTFLSRAMGPELLGGLEAFDMAIDECLRNLLSLPIGDNNMVMLRGISPGNGGLGMPRRYGANAELQLLLSHAMVKYYITRHHRDLLPVSARYGVWPASRFVEFASGPDQDVSPEDLDSLASEHASVIRKAAKIIISARECDIVQELLMMLPVEGQMGMGKQAALVSRRRGMESRGAWWRSLAGNGRGEGYFPSAHFVLALRHYLLAPLLNSRGDDIVSQVRVLSGRWPQAGGY